MGTSNSNLHTPASDSDRLLGAVDLAARDAISTVVTVERSMRAALRDVVGRGGLERALFLLESEQPPRIAVRPRRERGKVTISELLEDDHRRLDELAERARGTPERPGSSDPKALRAFVWGLRRHIRIEEELLFPRFEEATGMRGVGPTSVMRAEHLEIDDHLAALDAHTRPGRGLATDVAEAQLASSFAQLAALLEEHNAKEEHVLYPTSDRMLSETERAELVHAIMLF